MVISFVIRLSAERPRTRVAVTIRTADGLPIALIDDKDANFVLGNHEGASRVELRFDDIRLYPGVYVVSLWVSNWANTEVIDHAEDCLTFRIVDGGRLTMRPLPRHSGLFFLTPTWTASAPEAEIVPMSQIQPPRQKST